MIYHLCHFSFWKVPQMDKTKNPKSRGVVSFEHNCINKSANGKCYIYQKGTNDFL